MSDPHWLVKANEARARIERARARAAQAADERARWIAIGVEEYGRGGRKRAAELLGISIGEVDKALARARGLTRPACLPDADELLERLYELEMPELAKPERQVLAYIVRGAFIDVSWVEQPGELLAQEVEAIDPGELPAGVDQKALAAQCRAWTRIQALAVINAMNTGAGQGGARPDEGTSS
ncbi:MAG: hypothetical protein DIU60_023410 [Actinomycetes bacterium]